MTSLPTIPSYISGEQKSYLLNRGFLMLVDEEYTEFFNGEVSVIIKNDILTVRRNEVVENVFRGVSGLDDMKWMMLLHAYGVAEFGAKEIELTY